MRVVVCPQDVKKMLLKQARMVCWKTCAAKHECEKLKGGVRLEPIPSCAAKKDHEVWRDKHRHVANKQVVEGGCVRKRLYDIGWSDGKKSAKAATKK